MLPGLILFNKGVMSNPVLSIDNPFLTTRAERPKNSVSVGMYDDTPGFVVIQHRLTGRELVTLESGAVLSRNNLTQISEIAVSHSLLHVVTPREMDAAQRLQHVQGVAHTIASTLTLLRQADVGFNDQPVPLDAYDIQPPGIENVPLLGYAMQLFGNHI